MDFLLSLVWQKYFWVKRWQRIINHPWPALFHQKHYKTPITRE